MAHAKHKHHHPLVTGEALIARLFFLIIGVYFIARVVISANARGVFSDFSFTGETFSGLWVATKDAWVNDLGPIFIILNFIFLGIALFATVKVWPLRQKISIFAPPSHGHHHEGHEEGHGADHAAAKNPAVLRHWTTIVRKANTGTLENLRSAVLEADALVDFYLKQAGFQGEHMAERLNQLKGSDLKTLDRLWDAHRLRNELAHTPGFELGSKQAEKALLAFRDFLKEMKAF